ncbi:MBL fold metallo-hydrolase [Solicola sp. PLA-1-18]|uniref:MBL fold metallo-hydrolase n=1 Tax=Solicola sp. PLA-1-18 TaxID=3380532 RepID=UPI003B77B84B
MVHDVGSGIHRIAVGNVSCYLVEDTDGVTLVDAGLPRAWGPFCRALDELGLGLDSVRAVVLTHGHFDHVGIAARLARRTGVPVWVHADDRHLAAHPFSYRREVNPLTYPVRHPRGLPGLAAVAAAGAPFVRGVQDCQVMAPGQVLDVPGRPVVVHSPGHTDGHCAVHLPERDTLFTGDALVTRDPYTGRAGPQIVSGAATASSRQAKDSLGALAETGAGLVLPGHGEPWVRGIGPAADIARRRRLQ